MSNLLNKQVLVLFDNTDRNDTFDRNKAWLGGVIGTVITVELNENYLGETVTTLIICSSEYNEMLFWIKQINHGNFYLETYEEDNVNFFFYDRRGVSIIPLPPVPLLPVPLPPSIGKQRSIFDIWLKRVVITLKNPNEKMEGIVTNLKVKKINGKLYSATISVYINISDDYGKMTSTTIFGSSELFDFVAINPPPDSNIDWNELENPRWSPMWSRVVSIILPDERNLQLLNKRFKRVMSLDALTVVAKYLICRSSDAEIYLVMNQAGVSREKAIEALKINDGDVVNSIIDLTM